MTETELRVAKSIIHMCSEHIVAPIGNLLTYYTKAEAETISHCLNIELGAYGLKTYVSPDKISIFIDDEGMCKVLDFFKSKGYQPVLTPEYTKRVSTVVEFANKNNVDLLWAQSGLRKNYYLKK